MEINGNVFKFSGVKNKDDPGLAEYGQRLDSQGESPGEPEMVSDELLVVGTSPRILELVHSTNRSTPSMSSDSSIDTIEPFGDLNLDDVDDLSDDINAMNDKIDKQKKSRDDICKLSNITNKFKFNSTRRLHGDRAEMILHKQFGPRYSGKNYIVFKGEMAFCFKYPICYPKSDVNETKWCL